MNEASQKLGIPLNCVFPVVNYSTHEDKTTNMDVLILSTFKHVINYAGDFISENMNSEIYICLWVFFNEIYHNMIVTHSGILYISLNFVILSKSACT